jgi:hypothetical protein
MRDVGSNTGLPGSAVGRRNLHHLPIGARFSPPIRAESTSGRCSHPHLISGRAAKVVATSRAICDTLRITDGTWLWSGGQAQFSPAREAVQHESTG